MDYDNDGILDLVSGSYDPGAIYLFPGLGNSAYGARQTLLDENQLPLVHHPEELARYLRHKEEQGDGPESADGEEVASREEIAIHWRVASFGSWPALVDWDNDGDLDVLIGSFNGQLFRRENIGTREEPRYSGDSIQVDLAEGPLEVACHACPAVADWDGDGRWDLVVGSGDGSVGWYRNVGQPETPLFEARRALIEPNPELLMQKFVIQNLERGELPLPGARAQVCVVDYNQDGKPDLIVGDCSDVNWTRKLTDEERHEMSAMSEQYDRLCLELSDLRQTLAAEKEAAVARVVEQIEELDTGMQQFIDESRPASFLLLYLRSENAVDWVKQESGPDKWPLATDSNEDVPMALSESPVTFTVSLEQIDADKQGALETDSTIQSDKGILVIKFDVAPGWHMYLKSRGSDKQIVNLQTRLPEGVRAEGDWVCPAGQPATGMPGDWILIGAGSFRQKLAGLGGTTEFVTVEIVYQVCNDQMCLPPDRIVRKVTVAQTPND